MVIRGNGMALSVLAVGTAAVAGYLYRNRASRARQDTRSKADVGARIVDEAPEDATVVNVNDRRLRSIPGVGSALARALKRNAQEEWAHVTLDDNEAWTVVDRLRQSLPYYDADGDGYNGVYVRCGTHVVVIDAIGWVEIEDPLY